MHTHEANRVAVAGRTEAVRRALKSLGMRRCSARLVQYQFKPDSELRLDWYGLFWRWFRALWAAHRAGAEFLYEDFRARVEALRGEEAPRGDWYEQVARCELEHSQALRAAIVARDPARISAEIADDIREKRRLLAMLGALPKAAAGAA